MGVAEAVESVQKLMSAFRQDIRQETLVIYAEKLADVPNETLAAVVDRAIETLKFFPSIGELRGIVAETCGQIPATAAEVNALTRRADARENKYRRDGSLAYVERYWNWPEDADPRTIALAQEVLAIVGEPCDANGKEYFAWETDFKKAYEPIYERELGKVLADLSQARLPAPAPASLTDGAS